MKFFNIFLVFSFFFFIGCGENGATRVVEEENQETVSDNDPTNPDDPANPDDPTDDPTNPTDDPTNPTDDPTNPTDDPTNPTDDPTNPTDDPTNPTDEPTNPTDNPTDPTDDPTVEPGSDEAKCVAAGGTWDEFEEDELKKCYKIVNCEVPEGENADYIVWRSDQSYSRYYDFDDDTWVGPSYDSEYGDTGEPKICQYICAANTVREDNKCKPLCSAVFNGSSSRIEVATNDLLALGTSWTIEAWVKQNFNNLTTDDEIPIVRKGNGYYLSGFYKSTSQQKTYYNMEGNFVYTYNVFGSGLTNEADFTAKAQYQNNTANSPIVTDGWNHVALSYYINSDVAHLRLYINGHLAKETTKETDYYAPNKVSTALMIGYYENNSGWSVKKYYFNGKIDQLKISTNTYQSEFTPSKLSNDDNTIAFYDFSNNANDGSGNDLNGLGTNVTYSTDCAF